MSDGRILVHALDQGLDAGEFQLLADEADKGHIEGLAIKITVEVKQENLEQRGAIVEGRAPAEACNAIEPGLAAAGPELAASPLWPASAAA